jgi:hypothetical protein
MPLRTAVSASSGNFDTLIAGSVTGGSAIIMGDNFRQKVRGLSAKVVVLAETDTITIACKWQVSNDNSTWLDVANGTQNAAAVVLATGTAGADASVTKVFSAPDAAYGYKFARIALVNGVVTGAAVDTYSLSYNYRAGA